MLKVGGLASSCWNVPEINQSPGFQRLKNPETNCRDQKLRMKGGFNPYFRWMGLCFSQIIMESGTPNPVGEVDGFIPMASLQPWERSSDFKEVGPFLRFLTTLLDSGLSMQQWWTQAVGKWPLFSRFWIFDHLHGGLAWYLL